MKRNIGLDILKILSMCGIVGLHIINNGGIYNAAVKWGGGHTLAYA